VFRYFTYRLYPSKRQARCLEATLEVCCAFNNRLVDQRLAARREGRPLGLAAQLREVAVFRRSEAAAVLAHSHTLQLVAADVDRAWRTRLRQAKGAGGVPGRKQWVQSFGFKQARNGFHVDGRRLRLFGVGRIAVRWHRPLQGTVKTLRVARKAGRWFAGFGCEIVPTPRPLTCREVGIDLGTDDLAILSDGERVPRPRWALAAQDRLAALRRRLRRANPGTAGYSKARALLGRAMVRVAARRRDYIAKVVARLVADYDRLALEDLDADRLARMRASVSDAGWGLFRRLLLAKAEATGRTVTLVRAAWTSQTCSACGRRSRRWMPLSQRTFACERCGWSGDRDVNAARVVLHLGQQVWGSSASQAGPQPVGAKEAEPRSRRPVGCAERHS